MKKSILVAVALVVGASWAMARGPEVHERMNAVEKQGAGTGSTTLALEQAAINRGETTTVTPYMRDRAVPAAAREPAAAPVYSAPQTSPPVRQPDQYPDR